LVNLQPVNIVGFVHTSGNESIAGEKTFSDSVFMTAASPGGLVISGDLTVQGTTTTINVDTLAVEDDIILINRGAASAPAGGSGLEVDRGVSDNIHLVWDDAGVIGNNSNALRWVGGVIGSEEAFATVDELQPDYELVVGTGNAIYTGLSVTFVTAVGGKTNNQVFVNGIKQLEGGGNAYTITDTDEVTFTGGNEPAVSDSVEFYAFGTIV